MSQVTIQDVNKIARLARIEIEEEKKDKLAHQLGDIITWVEDLNEVDTKNVDIVNNIHGINLPLFEDKISDGDKAEEVLKNAPESKYNYFTVPKVIE